MSSSSVVTLVAVTEEAERALGATRVRLAHFPVRVGRERGAPESDATLPADASRGRNGGAPQANDLYLQESPSASSWHISSEHFAIECMESLFVLVDLASACGTIVAGKRIGGSRQGGRTELRDGDVVVVGTKRSPYVFRCEISIE